MIHVGERTAYSERPVIRNRTMTGCTSWSTPKICQYNLIFRRAEVEPRTVSMRSWSARPSAPNREVGVGTKVARTRPSKSKQWSPMAERGWHRPSRPPTRRMRSPTSLAPCRPASRRQGFWRPPPTSSASSIPGSLACRPDAPRPTSSSSIATMPKRSPCHWAESRFASSLHFGTRERLRSRTGSSIRPRRRRRKRHSRRSQRPHHRQSRRLPPANMCRHRSTARSCRSRRNRRCRPR